MLDVKKMLKYWNMVLRSQEEALLEAEDMNDIEITLGLIKEAEYQIEKYSKM